MSMKGATKIDEKIGYQRSSFRLTTLPEEPVYLEVDLGGKVRLPVTELGGGGARVLCHNCQSFFDGFYIGEPLGKSVLLFPEGEMPEVRPVIRWKSWPCIGVEFVKLSNKERADIFRFLFKLERKKIKRMNMEEEPSLRS
jgi:hypothetical protein